MGRLDSMAVSTRGQLSHPHARISSRTTATCMNNLHPTSSTPHLRPPAAGFLRPQVPIILSKTGVDILHDKRPHDGFTALHMIAKRNLMPLAAIVSRFQQGVDWAVEDGLGATPLHWAAFKGHLEMVSERSACVRARRETT
jgi:hypothetical protein